MNAWCIRLAYLVRTDPVSEMSGQAIAKTIEPKNLDIICSCSHVILRKRLSILHGRWDIDK